MKVQGTALVMVACMCAVTAWAAPAQPVSQVADQFLDAYVAGDWDKVRTHLSPKHLYVYGTDVSEFATGPAEFKTMFDADQKLWRGAASLGETTQVSEIDSGSVATLFFTREFTLGDRVMKVRFSTVWEREKGEWKLVQSSNTVPTAGQSAAEILKAQAQ